MRKKLKKITKILGALGMSLAVLVTSSVAGYAAESVSLKDKNFEYSIDKNTEGTKGIFITKYIGSDKKVTIPDAIEGKKVIEIGEHAFSNNKNIEEISMPNGVVRICEMAFSDCTNLKSVNLSKSLKYIDDSAFAGTAMKKIKFPKKLITIGVGAFQNTKLETIKLPENLKYINSFAFEGNSVTGKIKVPDSVLKVGKDAFGSNFNYKKVVMPSYLKITSFKKNYVAMATVTSKKKTKDYEAIYIKKIKAKTKKITLKKKSKKLQTIAYVKGLKSSMTGILKNNILKYSSSNPKVVKVTSKGILKPVKKGTAKVKVTLRTTKASFKVKVVVK